MTRGLFESSRHPGPAYRGILTADCESLIACQKGGACLVTVTQGTNTIVGNDPEQVVRETPAVLGGKDKVGQTPELRTWNNFPF